MRDAVGASAVEGFVPADGQGAHLRAWRQGHGRASSARARTARASVAARLAAATALQAAAVARAVDEDEDLEAAVLRVQLAVHHVDRRRVAVGRARHVAHRGVEAVVQRVGEGVEREVRVAGRDAHEAARRGQHLERGGALGRARRLGRRRGDAEPVLHGDGEGVEVGRLAATPLAQAGGRGVDERVGALRRVHEPHWHAEQPDLQGRAVAPGLEGEVAPLLLLHGPPRRAPLHDERGGRRRGPQPRERFCGLSNCSEDPRQERLAGCEAGSSCDQQLQGSGVLVQIFLHQHVGGVGRERLPPGRALLVGARHAVDRRAEAHSRCEARRDARNGGGARHVRRPEAVEARRVRREGREARVADAVLVARVALELQRNDSARAPDAGAERPPHLSSVTVDEHEGDAEVERVDVEHLEREAPVVAQEREEVVERRGREAPRGREVEAAARERQEVRVEPLQALEHAVPAAARVELVETGEPRLADDEGPGRAEQEGSARREEGGGHAQQAAQVVRDVPVGRHAQALPGTRRWSCDAREEGRDEHHCRRKEDQEGPGDV